MKLLNFGSCNIDHVYQLEHVVAEGETQSSLSVQNFPGGKGLNQSISAARAGVKVYHAGAIGSDGEMLLKLLIKNGVDVTYLKTVNENTGHAIIQVTNSGDNAIFIYSGANARIDKEYINCVLNDFTKGDVLLLQNEISNVDYIVDRAYEKGMTIILNPSPINDNLKKISIDKLSYLILNEIEAKTITGKKTEQECLDFFKTRYPKLKVMLTLGKRGSVYQYQNQKYYQRAFNVVAVDTTAAGDTFTGYFVAGITRKMEIRKNIKIATCASAISVSRQGAAPSIPSMYEVENSIQKMSLNEESLQQTSLRKTIEKLINENIATVNLESISKELGYSTLYTSALIKKLFGETYKELLINKRLDVASELLQNSKLSITEIITTVGYENEGYFRKKFIQKFGKKPLEYRNNFR